MVRVKAAGLVGLLGVPAEVVEYVDVFAVLEAEALCRSEVAGPFAGVSMSGARRIRTADLLGAIQALWIGERCLFAGRTLPA